MTRREMLGSASCAAAMLLGGCGSGRETLRFRVTAEFTTPRGLRSGSSIQEIYHGGRFPLLPGGDRHVTTHRGEAVAVDLDEKTLFIVVAPFPDWLKAAAQGAAQSAPPLKPVPVDDWPANRATFMRRFRDEAATVTARLRDFSSSDRVSPVFIWFPDMSDPLSMQRVDPNDIETVFGAGISLSRFKFIATEEPFTDEIRRRLPWWDRLRDYKFDKQHQVSWQHWSYIEGLRIG